jgi:hypothetical protein
MRRNWLALLFVLFANTLHAQEHCPPGTDAREHHGGNDTISWTSLMVRTPAGICFERRVVVQRDLYINWPAAEIKKVVHLHEASMRCCYLDSTAKPSELEYGLLASKMPTTVYQGTNEVAQANSFGVDGNVQSGKTWIPFAFNATAFLLPDSTCKSEKDTCRSFWYTITSEGSPVILRWSDAVSARFDSPPKPGLAGGELMLLPGATVSLNFVGNLPKPSDQWITMLTPDGTHMIAKLPAAQVPQQVN